MSEETNLHAARSVKTFSRPSEMSEGPSAITTTYTLEVAPSPLVRLEEPQTIMSTAYHPIHKLPPELLATVFQSYSDKTIAEFRKGCLLVWVSGRIPAYSWLKLRHVCRLWREVACSSPSLHTHIVLADPECVADQLRRSGDLPLSVYAIHGYYRLSPQAILESWRLVFQQQHHTRIRCVWFQWTASHDSALRSPDFSVMELPNLQDLYLFTMDAFKDVYNPLPPLYHLTPFSGMQLPDLRSYTCRGGLLLPYLFDILLHKPLSRTLRCLEFTFISRQGVSPTPNILDLLDELALLEKLELQVTRDMVFGDLNGRRKTVLRHLTSLRLCEGDVLGAGDAMGAATTFLSHLVYPAAAHTTIESHLVLHHELHIARAEAEVIASRFAGAGVLDGILLGEPRFMKLDTNSGVNGVAIELWDASMMSTINLVAPEPPPPIFKWRIQFATHHQETMMHVFLSCVFEVLPLTNVAGMVIASHQRTNYFCLSLVDILHTLRRLTGIRVLGTHKSLLVEELSKAMQDDTGGRIFPHLRHWSIIGLDQYHAAPGDETRTATRQALRQLSTALLHRRNTGARMQSLDLDTGYIFGRKSDEEAAIVLSPDIIGDLDEFRWILPEAEPRTLAKVMLITNRLVSISSAV